MEEIVWTTVVVILASALQSSMDKSVNIQVRIFCFTEPEEYSHSTPSSNQSLPTITQQLPLLPACYFEPIFDVDIVCLNHINVPVQHMQATCI